MASKTVYLQAENKERCSESLPGHHCVARDVLHSHCEAHILSDTGRHRRTKILLEMLQREHFWLRERLLTLFIRFKTAHKSRTIGLWKPVHLRPFLLFSAGIDSRMGLALRTIPSQRSMQVSIHGRPGRGLWTNRMETLGGGAGAGGGGRAEQNSINLWEGEMGGSPRKQRTGRSCQIAQKGGICPEASFPTRMRMLGEYLRGHGNCAASREYPGLEAGLAREPPAAAILSSSWCPAASRDLRSKSLAGPGYSEADSWRAKKHRTVSNLPAPPRDFFFNSFI